MLMLELRAIGRNLTDELGVTRRIGGFADLDPPRSVVVILKAVFN